MMSDSQLRVCDGRQGGRDPFLQSKPAIKIRGIRQIAGQMASFRSQLLERDGETEAFVADRRRCHAAAPGDSEHLAERTYSRQYGRRQLMKYCYARGERGLIVRYQG